MTVDFQRRKGTANGLLDVHYLRHTHDAILVGVQTVLHDNPFLTTCLPHGGKNPIRFMLERHLRTPKTANVATDRAAETIIINIDSTESEIAYFEHPRVSMNRISEYVPFLNEVLKRLRNKGIMTLFVEGGSSVHSSFINEGFADELYLNIAPKLIGKGVSLFMEDT